MPTEIERKFLVSGQGWKPGACGTLIRQGYLSLEHERTVRVRSVEHQSWLTIKGPLKGFTRVEFEYPIPSADAREILQTLCRPPIIQKTRYEIRHGSHTWAVDEFHGANEGLVVAEIELDSEQEPFATPPWLGKEVSGDPCYFNVNLVMYPFRDW